MKLKEKNVPALSFDRSKANCLLIFEYIYIYIYDVFNDTFMIDLE